VFSARTSRRYAAPLWTITSDMTVDGL